MVTYRRKIPIVASAVAATMSVIVKTLEKC